MSDPHRGPVEAPRIVVVGSSNTDLIVRAPAIPRPGQTVLGSDLITAAGGKGANQAVAAARLGARVTLVARLGVDDFGDRAWVGLRAEGIDTDFIVRDPDAPSGVALIVVGDDGENAIAVAPGANARLTPTDVERAADVIRAADVVLLQLEIPLESVAAAARLGRAGGALVILNPAPATSLSGELVRSIDILTPNEAEAAALAAALAPERDAAPAEASPEAAARALRAAGVGAVLVTMGAAGVLVHAGDESLRLPARSVDAADTTGAGDAFNGALAVALAHASARRTSGLQRRGRAWCDTLREAARFAMRAAEISVTRLGAQPSLPTQEELASLD